MSKHHWMMAGGGALVGLAVGLAIGFRAVEPSLPDVSASPPPSELIDLTDRDPIEQIVRAEPVVFYQYTDDSGTVRFASTLHEVPEAWRERAGRFELAGLPPTSPAAARMQRKLAADRASTEDR